MSARAVLRAVRAIARGRGRRPRPGHDRTRVLQLIETGGPGGAERMLLHLSRQLPAIGCDAEIGLLKPGWLEASVKRLGLPLATIRPRGAGDLGVIAELIEVVRDRRVDVLHAHEFYMATMGAAVSRITGVPLVITIHGKNYYPDRRRRRVMYRLAASEASRAVAVSRDLADFFCRTTGTPASAVEVVYNGIDVDAVADIRRDPELLAAAGIPREARLVGAVGNLYPVKGHTYLVRAMAAVVADEPLAHLVVLGRGSLHDTLRAEADGLGIGGHVHFLGHREDVPQWVAAMDIFALPSLSEGLPLSVLEAMAAARPIVVSSVGGVPEVVQDGANGFVVPPATPEALATRIGTLLRDAPLAGAMGAAALATIRERFSLEQMTRHYGALYERALRGKRARGVAAGGETTTRSGATGMGALVK